jgi:hypothetical protein
MRFREGAFFTVMAALPLGSVLGACTNDYGSLDFSGDPAREGGALASGGRTPSTGGAGTGGTGTSGTGGQDAASMDGGTGGADGAADASVEAAAGGARAVDASSDVGTEASVESGAGDGAPPDGAADGGPPTCSDRYGGANDFVLCGETADQCVIAVRTAGNTCNALCEFFGGTCLGATDNQGAPCVPFGTGDDCNTMHNTEICTCTR